MDPLYQEIDKLFYSLALVTLVCLLVALIVLAGSASRWLRAHTHEQLPQE